MRVQRYLLVTGIIATVALAGCSSDSSSDQSSSSAAGSADQKAAPGKAPGGTAKDQVAESPDLGIDQRSIIYTGSITVQVKDVNVAATQATAAATMAGGFVGGDERHSGEADNGIDSASIILRVPAEKFTAIVQQVAELGDEQERQTSTEDVTEQTVDLDARITVQQARVASGRQLLAKADSLADLVMLEKEVATRESDLASLQAKKRKLADLTALSTITAVLVGPEAVIVTPKDEPIGFLSGLAGGWHALLAFLVVLLAVVGALLPWVLALGIPGAVVFYLIRRFRPARPPLAPPAPQMQAPSAPPMQGPPAPPMQGRQ